MKEAPFLAPTGEGTPTTVLAALGPKMLQLAATEADGAAEQAILEVIQALPDGFDTVVGERGDGLSVGERQLVALARAQIAHPGLLLSLTRG